MTTHRVPSRPAPPGQDPGEPRPQPLDEAAEPALATLVGAEVTVPCVDGAERPYRDLDCAASTSALPAVAGRVAELLPWYASVHRGAGFKSRAATAAYEGARLAVLEHCGRPPGTDDVAIICRNTTEAINHLAYRLRFEPGDVVVTTVVEHHANLLPWTRAATVRWVECGPDGTFGVDDVAAVLDAADVCLNSFPCTSITSVLEAAMYGVPTLSLHDTPGTPLTFDDFFVEPRSASSRREWVDAVAHWCEEPAEREAAGARMKSQAERGHSGPDWEERLARGHLGAPRGMAVLPSAAPGEGDASDVALVRLHVEGGMARDVHEFVDAHRLEL